MEICFILYRPGVPGNVGAAARAINTMGFSSLRLIQPCDYLGEEARKLAHGSNHILEKASVYDSYDSAVKDLDLVICTTARGRTAKHDYHSSRDIRALIENKAEHLGKVGLIFGTEESGLPNKLILKADLAMSIPMKTSYPSLNLGQAVMLTAYELSPLNELSKPGQSLKKSGEGWGELKNSTEKLLEGAGIMKGTPLYHRIMERLSTIGANDIPLFLSVIKGIKNPL